MTANEYLTVLAEIDADLVSYLRGKSALAFASVWAGVQRDHRNKGEVFVLARLKRHAVISNECYTRIDPRMEERLRWFQ